MTAFTESVVEEATLRWLAELGYSVAHGPEIAPEALFAERTDYRQTILERAEEFQSSPAANDGCCHGQ